MSTLIADAATIARMLGEGSCWGPIDVVASTGSTNADVAAEARAGGAPGRVLVAREQISGRGRLDRKWESPPDRSVAMSFLLQPSLSFEHWGWLSLLAGIAVQSALTDLYPELPVELKWPNDVLIEGKKVCGILSERVERNSGAMAVVGIGINISHEADELPVPTATSLLLEGVFPDVNAVVAGVLSYFSDFYAQWLLAGSLRIEYEARCASIGAEIDVNLDANTTYHGFGHGVDGLGRLQLATRTGILVFAAGDVEHAQMNR